jgi:hypothetical protein
MNDVYIIESWFGERLNVRQVYAADADDAWLAARAYPVARAEFEADARRRAEQAIALIRRADQQHALVMADDDRGVYGVYPP